MEKQPVEQQNHHQVQPQSLASEGDDFVVITDSSGSSPPTILSPTQEETEPHSSDFQLSLARPAASASESEFQTMAKQISKVNEQLQDSLKDNQGSLDQVRMIMSEMKKKLVDKEAELVANDEQSKKKLADKDAELVAKVEQCESLLAKNEQMKSELSRLRTREEEWEQTNKDYQSLKNQYNLLTNTKERLETEKADLQRSRDEALAAETQKLQAKFDEERSAAVEAERTKMQRELMDLQAKHVGEVKALRLELTGAKKENEGNLQTARDEKEQALSNERERCRLEADRLLAEHTSAIETIRNELENKIQEQVRQTEEARQELQQLNNKHEAEKAEMLDMVKQFNVSSFSTEQFRSVDAITMTDSSLSCGNCKELQEVREREAVQEQGQNSLASACGTPAVDAVVTSVCVSVSTSERGTSMEAANPATSSSGQLGVNDGQSGAGDQQPELQNQRKREFAVNSVESQTDPLECPIEDSESLQRNSAARPLMLQLASFASALKTEREKNEDLEKSLKQLRQENARLEVQFHSRIASSSGSTAAMSRGQHDEKVTNLRKQLDDKQSELDSLLKDFDETRNKVYELTEKVKYHESRKMKLVLENETGCADSPAQQSGQKDNETSRLRKQLDDKQSELNSLLEDFDETRHKVYELNEKVKDCESRAKQGNEMLENGTTDGNFAAQQVEEISKLRKQLDDKQSEMDSLLEDFDETRNKVYELNEKVKEYKSRAEQRAHLASSRASSTGGDARRLEKLLAEKQVELDSVLEDFDETRTKVYELTEKVKDYESRSERRDHSANVRSGPWGSPGGDAATRLAEKQSELDSVIKDLDETRNKVCELNEKVKDYESRLKLTSPAGGIENDAATSDSAVQRSCQKDNETDGLRKQLDDKQLELDSIIKDLDETRNKVNELNEKVKDYESRSAHSDSQTEKLKQKIKDLESQADIDRNLSNQLQMEIDTIRKEERFKATKLQAAENKVEQMQQEIKKLETEREGLRKLCQANDETVQQVMASSDDMKREIEKLKDECEMQRQVLDQNRQLLEEKASVELQLRETITELTDRMERHAEERDRKLMEEKRKFEQLYGKMCEQSELRVRAEQLAKSTKEQLRQENQKLVQAQRQLEASQQQSRQYNDQLEQLRKQLNEANSKLQDSEKFAADLQTYSDGADTQIENLKQQLENSNKKRDDVIQVAEQIRHRLEEQLRKSAECETELQRVNFEHSKLRTQYSDMERNVTEMLAKEHELNWQLEELEGKLRQAEEAIRWYRIELQNKDAQIAGLAAERDDHKARVNNLLEALEGQEQQQATGDPFFNTHRTMRPGGGNN